MPKGSHKKAHDVCIMGFFFLSLKRMLAKKLHLNLLERVK
jgi:hypothetical protein